MSLTIAVTLCLAFASSFVSLSRRQPVPRPDFCGQQKQILSLSHLSTFVITTSQLSLSLSPHLTNLISSFTMGGGNVSSSHPFPIHPIERGPTNNNQPGRHCALPFLGIFELTPRRAQKHSTSARWPRRTGPTRVLLPSSNRTR
jgi:hypothetical protein